jgi:hypothetical protein
MPFGRTSINRYGVPSLAAEVKTVVRRRSMRVSTASRILLEDIVRLDMV